MASVTVGRSDFDQSFKGRAARTFKRISSREGVQHLIRMNKRFGDRLGTQFAAALTYLSFLSLVPILMVLFSIAGFVLVNNQELLDQLRQGIADQIPSQQLAGTINEVLDTAIDQRIGVGIVGLLIALYSGIGWMGNLREALEAQWRPVWEEDPAKEDNFALATVKDLGRLVGLGLAIAVTLGLTTAGTAIQTQILTWLGLEDQSWLTPVITVLTLLIAMVADVLIFLWLYRTLPGRQYQVPRAALIKGAVVAAVLFELLKSLLSFLLQLTSGSASWQVFGPIIGLLFFFNLVARMVLMVGAWIATSKGGPKAPEPEPEIPEAQVMVTRPVSRPRVAGLLGVGALIGWVTARRSK
ncbi:inner membrane protein YhjD [Nakamurella leprariae]|uniref:Inner membrane protein YhjD n=1 Tax=Nakamurella leprariae TaxID=2803911 RepID=A0A939BZF5_9ACTN|nr:inner membrane protein YhjD [Nakamurella leprariae]MBM9467651.1 inner membrane protein YhjD [Nakamurella leprariae]